MLSAAEPVGLKCDGEGLEVESQDREVIKDFFRVELTRG